MRQDDVVFMRQLERFQVHQDAFALPGYGIVALTEPQTCPIDRPKAFEADGLTREWTLDTVPFAQAAWIAQDDPEQD